MKAVQRLVVGGVGKRQLALSASSRTSSSSSSTIARTLLPAAAAATTSTTRPLTSTPLAWTTPLKPAASFSSVPNITTTTPPYLALSPSLPSSPFGPTAAATTAGRASRRRPRFPSSSQPLPLAPFSSLFPSSSSSSSSTTQKRGLMTQATTTSSSLRTQRPPSPLVPSLPSSSAARRYFWSPKFIRQLGLPWFAQVFYGTIFVIGVGVLAISLFATSTVFAVLFLVAFAGFKLLNRQPHLMRQVMRRQRAPGAPPSLFGPLIDMMTDGVLLDGLKNARGAIERDVLGIINSHPGLGRYGNDFHTTGLHKMSMQVVNGGEKHVVIQFLVASSKPREMFVQVVASRHEEEMGEEREGMERWDYEDVSVQTPEGKVIDLTEELLKGKATGKRIVIDVAPRGVKEEE